MASTELYTRSTFNKPQGWSIARPQFLARALLFCIFLYISVAWPLLNREVALSLGGGDILNQIIWIFFFVASGLIFAMARTRLAFFMIIRAHVPLLLLVLWALMSTVWSLSADATIRRATLQIVAIASLLFTISTISDRKRVFDDLLLIWAGVAAVNLAAAFIFPPTEQGAAGIYGSKNTLGAVAAQIIIWCLPLLIFSGSRLRLAAIFTTGVGALLLVLSGSKTSFGLTFIAPAIAILALVGASIVRMHLIPTLLLLVALAVAVTAFVMGTFYLEQPDVLEFFFGDPTFTGRTVIWDFLAYFIHQRPLHGFGHGGFWDIGPYGPTSGQGGFIEYLIVQAHNGYIDLVLQLGLVGLLLMLTQIVYTIQSIARATSWGSADIVATLASIIFVILHNMMESSLFRSPNVIWLTFLILSFSAVCGPAERRVFDHHSR